MIRKCLFLMFALCVPLSLMAQDAPGSDRSAAEKAAIRKWAGLPHDRQIRVLQTLGVTMSEEYLSCVCRAAGYGSSSTSQFYHPDTIGEFNPMYSCSQPGAPCIVGGFGCSRYDLPTDPALWESCAAQPEFATINPMTALITASRDRAGRKKITGDPVTKSPPAALDPPPDCAKVRAGAGLTPPAVLSDVPPERQIYSVSPASLERLAALDLPPDVRSNLMNFLQNQLANIHESIAVGDEKDLRFDFGAVEVGASIDAQRRLYISEIVVKTPVSADGGVLGKINGEGALSLTLADPNDPAAIGNHKPAGVRIGFSYEGKIEAKYGIEITRGKTTDDFYDGEWQQESEWKVVQGVENVLSNLDFYAGGAAGKEVALPYTDGGVVTVGPEVTWKLKDRYSSWLFSDMTSALDNLLENQKAWEEKRREYLTSEAKRFGVDARCFSVGETITLTRAAWQKRAATEPGLAAPFASLNKTGAKPAKPSS